jgi:hypothetical protein
MVKVLVKQYGIAKHIWEFLYRKIFDIDKDGDLDLLVGMTLIEGNMDSASRVIFL